MSLVYNECIDVAQSFANVIQYVCLKREDASTIKIFYKTKGVTIMKKIIAFALAACLCLALAVSASADGSVYYLNFKPEQDAQWQELAKLYTEQTGVPVTVVTAASGNYETTLMSEIEKSDPPTLFQVNGPVGLANWKDYCYDLKDADITKHLTSDSFALKEGDTVLRRGLRHRDLRPDRQHQAAGEGRLQGFRHHQL